MGWLPNEKRGAKWTSEEVWLLWWYQNVNEVIKDVWIHLRISVWGLAYIVTGSSLLILVSIVQSTLSQDLESDLSGLLSSNKESKAEIPLCDYK